MYQYDQPWDESHDYETHVAPMVAEIAAARLKLDQAEDHLEDVATARMENATADPSTIPAWTAKTREAEAKVEEARFTLLVAETRHKKAVEAFEKARGAYHLAQCIAPAEAIAAKTREAEQAFASFFALLSDLRRMEMDYKGLLKEAVTFKARFAKPNFDPYGIMVNSGGLLGMATAALKTAAAQTQAGNSNIPMLDLSEGRARLIDPLNDAINAFYKDVLPLPEAA